MKLRQSLALAALASVMGAISVSAHAAAISPGDLVVYRVGTGSASLTNAANAVFLDEYNPTTHALVQSIALPTSVSGSNKMLTASGTATSEGELTISPDGKYLALTGYNAALGTTGPSGGSIANSTSADVPRTVGIVDVSTGAINTSTALTDSAIGGNNIRSAVTTDGASIWLGGAAGGVRYTTLGSTASNQISSSFTNVREVDVFGGQLYVSAGASSLRLGAVGTNLPTNSGQTITNLPGLPTSSGSFYGFYFADLSPSVAGLDTLYVSDDSTGIRKYSLVGGTWNSNGVVGTAADAYRGLTATVSSGIVSLFATRKGGSGATGGGELVSLSDNGGYNASFSSSTFTTIATASANTAFRGVAYVPVSAAPVPVPAAVWLFGSALAGLVGIGRRKA